MCGGYSATVPPVPVCVPVKVPRSPEASGQAYVAVTRFLLDTSTCIDLLRGRAASVATRMRRYEIDAIGISSISLAELHCGAMKSARPAHHEVLLVQLCAPLSIHAFDERAAQTYGRVRAELESGLLFYFDTQPEGKWLRMHRLQDAAPVDLATGRKIGAIDWSTRSFSDARFHPPSGRLFITSDEQNDEHLNVYALDLEGGTTRQVTSNDYTYGWSFSPDHELLGYIARSGLQEPFRSSLHVRNLETGEDRLIMSDDGGADRFTWTEVAFTPAKDRVIVIVQHDSNRKTVSLAQIDLANPSLDYLTPPRVVRYGLDQLREWVSDSEFLFRSSESSSLVGLPSTWR